ncbi:GNAT family N-acetyltransferase [Pelomonas sp. CA6]|uniref:GNAT family N-acetyltransferase n=1 Tax=Pelomonas sp. CA6 TaxID=2907999 RepID=UPI001F4A3228|nr:GNAT family N-acetyltransferase [Pelomonas sp. CA6]MCH7341992.1 GNAT family N-acetyltransferase [Pelomonas sp. CA6]
MSAADAPLLREVEREDEVLALFPLMAQLRPHLASAEEFLQRWRRQSAEGYRLVALYREDAGGDLQPEALAGYRVQENLVHGRFLYLDDLVTDQRLRSRGHGERLIRHLRELAPRLGCGKLVLDTPLSNALGQRFYFRMGLLASALRFNQPLPA